MTFNEFINSPDDMDEDSQEYKDFSQCVSSGAYVAFSIVEDILEATPTFNLSSADDLLVVKLYMEALGDVEDKEERKKEFLDKLSEFASDTSIIVMNRIKDSMRSNESYKIAVQTIEGDVLDIENDSSDESE